MNKDADLQKQMLGKLSAFLTRPEDFDFRGSNLGPVPAQAWGGTRAEIKCMRYQLAVMRRIGSSQSEIDNALTKADGQYVNDWDYEDSPPR